LSDREQRRIGRDLHDGLGQQLTAMELCAHALLDDLAGAAPSAVKALQELAHQLRQAVTQTRLLSHGLSPVSPEADGLMNALRELADGTRGLARIHCEFNCQPAVLVHDSHVATHLYRIAQEAVANALKHSHARHIQIRLDDMASRLTLTVSDDGRGLAPAPPPANGKSKGKGHGPGHRPGTGTGMGLRVMKYRADLMGAALTVDSSPRRGTRITCAVSKPT